MAINKPSIPKGTRDFSPDEMLRRNYIFDTIRAVFKKYGYQPIETPAMEKTETLMGKYGEEGDKLIFRILNAGPVLEQIQNSKLEIRYSDITEKALRYDLTVPFARYVVQHQNEITFPFKRYQIQPVWRADRPQKGRYREFFQCDADVIGSNSLINEVEIVQMIDEVFTALKVPVLIKINNRKILSGIAEYCGCPDKMLDIAIAIDKIDKIGKDAVVEELIQRGIPKDRIEDILVCLFPEEKDLVKYSSIDDAKAHGHGLEEARNIIMLQESDLAVSSEVLNCLWSRFWGNENEGGNIKPSEIGKKGCDEILEVFSKLSLLKLNTAKIRLDTTLARGLNYYTGAIFEVGVDREKCKSTFTSSITGGGRYDDLTGFFGLPNLSGVGISFGADRIYDVLNELNLYPESVTTGTRLLFINKGGKSESISLSLLKKVREKNIAAEIYPDNVKWEKQAKYVDAKKIPFTATVEEDGKITLKYSLEGKWKTENVSLEELIDKIK